MNIKNTQYLLDLTFNKYQPKDSPDPIYWRDCILSEDMIQGMQGYLWVFTDGETFHSYRTPAQTFE